MSITVEERAELLKLEDIQVDALSSYFIDLDGIQELCQDLTELYKKEQISTLGDKKYLKILEKEAWLVEDIALTAINFLKTHKKTLKVIKECASNHSNETKPKK
ncbi:hypothetical protein EDI_120670 [Entamoeba dispar SAW760]|uniref:Uncharacterized protein n=1 Tax=Entamoeba dispar (strain ATCC PRA-260 / SAW760) TaxID=370354 RepID=B0EJQ3_ENTDS|nr:uncharacterized protein EDI_120670 [Entamoeba dispar SAW760]XP_001739578.1 uncharacterized protein EDI_089520 [Entamoeba dispar SAW760]EDR24036.1 hypothetical protein EDI_089520 [Entamoeba dispar SAW760]EDR25249.1 hypothetical protein EDI_120670 [Entamoeba dispar SAW760]|eukprot:EDR24036.1 hypothetical protein EDI_089520 [Entamoeba dispar SAW760]